MADKLALWFGPPYNAWHVGNVAEVNYRRTKSENVSVEFKDDTDGETRGKFLATADTYGANKLWVLLKPIAINLDSDNDEDEAGAGSSGDAPSSSSKRPKDDTTEAASPPLLLLLGQESQEVRRRRERRPGRQTEHGSRAREMYGVGLLLTH